MKSIFFDFIFLVFFYLFRPWCSNYFLKISKNVKLILPEKKLDKRILARIKIGSYERHEMKLLKNYFQGNKVILELGGSLGFISCATQELYRPKMHVIIEGNSSLIPYLKKNLAQYKKTSHILIKHLIIGDSNKCGYFVSNKNTLASKVNFKQDTISKKYQLYSFNYIKRNYIKNKKYSLICDIEGAEKYIFKNKSDFTNCSEILIEAHTIFDNFSENDKNNMFKKLKLMKFKLIKKSGRAFYFKKSYE